MQTISMEKKESDSLLQIRNLKMHFPVKAGIILDHVVGWVKALDGIDLTDQPRQVLGWWESPEAGRPPWPKSCFF